jgi:hypothetical protein
MVKTDTATLVRALTTLLRHARLAFPCIVDGVRMYAVSDQCFETYAELTRAGLVVWTTTWPEDRELRTEGEWSPRGLTTCSSGATRS